MRCFLVIAVMLAATALPVLAQVDEVGESYEAFAVRKSARQSRTPVQVHIRRWTTASERESILKALAEEGQSGLVAALGQQPDAGYLRLRSGGAGVSPTNVTTRYAWPIDGGDERTVVVLVDRYVPMFGSSRRPQTSDFNLTLVMLELDADGNGSGTLISGVQVKLEDGRIALERALTDPVDLLNVARRK